MTNISALIASVRGVPATVQPKPVGKTVVLVDVSGSMALPIGNRRAIDIAQIAVNAVVPTIEDPVLYAFHCNTEEIRSGQHLPEPQGSTNLWGALILAQKQRPTHTVVVSDGVPNDVASALTAARELAKTSTIDALYIGPDGLSVAIEFMRDLARIGRGRLVLRDIAKHSVGAEAQMTADLSLLALPPPT